MTRLAAGVALVTCVGTVALAATPPPPVPWRAVRVGGSPADAAVRDHLSWSAARGFNRFAVACAALGDACLDPDHPPTRAACDVAAQHGARLWLVRDLEAWTAATRNRRTRRATRTALERLTESCPVDVVVDGYSADAAAPLSDLTRVAGRVRRLVGRDGTDVLARVGAATDLSRTRRARPALPADVAVIATLRPGLSESIADRRRAVERVLGPRAIVVEEPFPATGDRAGTGLALNLGALRRRVGERAGLSGYLATPMAHYLGGSRLSLATIGEFLTDDDYDAEDSWQRAIATLAGEDEDALEALRVQAVEWGGWYDELNYRPVQANDVNAACRHLRDPAALSGYSWTVRRYADRMWDLRGLSDEAFREDLLRVMRRRLAVARALPVLRRLLQPRSDDPNAPRGRLGEELSSQRRDLGEDDDLQATFDRLLAACGVPAPSR